jgi:ribosomal protein S3
MLKVNKLRLREELINRPELFGLSGFKLHFAGRFSRKQRASSISVQHGRMPLNTIDAHIEYAMHTNVAKNSTISVKV